MPLFECNRCKKQFHINCLKKWISHKELCPNCRNKVNSDDEIKIDGEIVNKSKKRKNIRG